MLQVIAVTADLVVDGEGGEDVGRFSGRVLAIALEPSSSGDGPAASETWLLVADDRRPAPVWVGQETVKAQRLGR